MTRILTIAVILASITTTAVITGFETGYLSHVQAQTLTPQQKAALCNPNNPKLKFVNSTESKICGIAETPKNATNATSIIPPQ
jgi:hypothetical protein